jgi:hypothetical protein
MKSTEYYTTTKTVPVRPAWKGQTKQVEIQMVRGTIAGFDIRTDPVEGYHYLHGYILTDGTIVADGTITTTTLPVELLTGSVLCLPSSGDLRTALITDGATIDAPASKVRAA